MTERATITDKAKEFLGRKLLDSRAKIIKLKRKRKITKAICIITAVSSIVISSVSVAISLLTIPPLVITVLSITSVILTGINAKFNFQDMEVALNREIDKLHKIQSKLDYVISCNGDLTQQEYLEILRGF